MTKVIASKYFYFSTLLLISVSCGNSNPTASPQVPYATGPATFTRSGNEIIVRGIIQINSLNVFNAVLNNDTGITIVLENVAGTEDAAASFAIGRRIRSAGLDTHIPDDGLVASGGTDIFVSGKNRTMGTAAFIGVHSWDSDGVIGIGLPESDQKHLPFITYYQEMGLPDEFYWFAVRSAPPGNVHWMTESEITKFNLVTPQSQE